MTDTNNAPDIPSGQGSNPPADNAGQGSYAPTEQTGQAQSQFQPGNYNQFQQSQAHDPIAAQRKITELSQQVSQFQSQISEFGALKAQNEQIRQGIAQAFGLNQEQTPQGLLEQALSDPNALAQHIEQLVNQRIAPFTEQREELQTREAYAQELATKQQVEAQIASQFGDEIAKASTDPDALEAIAGGIVAKNNPDLWRKYVVGNQRLADPTMVRGSTEYQKLQNEQIRLQAQVVRQAGGIETLIRLNNQQIMFSNPQQWIQSYAQQQQGLMNSRQMASGLGGTNYGNAPVAQSNAESQFFDHDPF
jgi:hypothetical protein